MVYIFPWFTLFRGSREPWFTYWTSAFYRDRDRYRTVFLSNGKKHQAYRTFNFVTVRFLVFDPEPYRTNMGIVIRLDLGAANGSRCPIINAKRPNSQRLSIHRTDFVAVGIAVPNNKRITVPHLVPCDSRSSILNG